MRIAVVSTSYPTAADDPAGHFVRTEVEELLARGHDVTVLAPAPCSAKSPLSTPPGATVSWVTTGDAFGWPGVVVRLKQRPWRVWDLTRFIVRARRQLQRGHYDHVIAHWLMPAGFPIAAGSGSPSIEIVVHGSDARLLRRLPRPVREGILSRALRGDVHLRFVSSALREELLAATRLPLRGRSSVKPCPIAVPALTRDQARAALGLGASERIAVVVARLIPSKRVDLALQQRPCDEPFQWVVIGDGPEQMTLARSYPQAQFLGRLAHQETLRWIAAADVLVNASAAEGAPTVVREARALHTRVLSSSVGDVALWAREDPGIELIADRRT